jgi:hypothetical protein
MKKNTTHELKSDLANCQRIEATLARDKKLWTDSTAELSALARSADLSNDSTVAQLSKLQTIVTFAPDRLDAHRREFDAAQKGLLDGCQNFVSKVFSPLCQQLEIRSLEKVEGKLRKLFPDEEALRSAALHSTELVQLATIKARVMNDTFAPEDAMRKTESVLDAWREADSFEQQYLS